MSDNILYHGSNVIVQNPKVLINGYYKDFGYGFYCTNLEKQARRWAYTRKGNTVINKYNYIKNENGNINVADVDTELVEKIPTATQMGKVYQRLIFDTALPHESEVDGIIRVYNDPICKVIDNYNCSAYYEPSYVIARAYQNGGF
jgi:hypothetical protein